MLQVWLSRAGPAGPGNEHRRAPAAARSGEGPGKTVCIPLPPRPTADLVNEHRLPVATGHVGSPAGDCVSIPLATGPDPASNYEHPQEESEWKLG